MPDILQFTPGSNNSVSITRTSTICSTWIRQSIKGLLEFGAATSGAVQQSILETLVK